MNASDVAADRAELLRDQRKIQAPPPRRPRRRRKSRAKAKAPSNTDKREGTNARTTY